MTCILTKRTSHRTALQIGDVCFYFLLPIGQVSQTVEPMSKAPVMHLRGLMSRSPSPTDTISRVNSAAPSRSASRSHSPDNGGHNLSAFSVIDKVSNGCLS